MTLGLNDEFGSSLVIVAVIAALLLAARVPLLRWVVRLAAWGVLVAMLYVSFDQRERLGFGAGLRTADEQQIVGEELRIRMAPDGHFWATARFGGIERRLLVDSGATVTALNTDTAAAAGLEPRDGVVPVVLRTANGDVRARTAEIAELRLGNIVARDLAVVVSPAFRDVDVLGMNFLSRLKSWRVEGKTLILVPHHPQAAGA